MQAKYRRYLAALGFAAAACLLVSSAAAQESWTPAQIHSAEERLAENGLYLGTVSDTLSDQAKRALDTFATGLVPDSLKGRRRDIALWVVLSWLNNRHEYDLSRKGVGKYLHVDAARLPVGRFRFVHRQTGEFNYIVHVREWEFLADGRCEYYAAFHNETKPQVDQERSYFGRCELAQWKADKASHPHLYALLLFPATKSGELWTTADLDHLIDVGTKRYHVIPSFSFEDRGDTLLINDDPFRLIGAPGG